MNAAGEFLGEGGVYHAVTFEPGLPLERRRYNIDPEMRLAAGPVPGVTFVMTGFIFDIDADRGKRRLQLVRDDLRHGLILAHDWPHSRIARLASTALSNSAPVKS